LASLTVENYVKAIFNICSRGADRAAATGEVANALNVSPGTVTSMLKSLDESGLVSYTPYEGVRLTETGSSLALRILRRHRLIELFLTQTLSLSWDEVHNDAEQLEHAITDFLVDRIDERLGHPKFDPHGDPIPASDGTMVMPEVVSLSACPVGYRFHLTRVVDQSPEFLRFLSRSGLLLGAEGKILENVPEAGTVTVEVAGKTTNLGREAAAKLLVAPADVPH
jgi:DtxR family transcriptional regulator, Mn-dependent transcriptional regulator